MRSCSLVLVLVALAACIERRDYGLSPDATIDALPLDEVMVTVTVLGAGHVGGDRRGIDCPSECVATYPTDGALTLTATPDSGAVFKEWQGDCDGDGLCVLDLSVSRAVTAMFVPAGPQQNLQVLMSGAGEGTVRSIPSGLLCTSNGSGGTCNVPFAEGSTVQLTAIAPSGSVFKEWGGACSGNAPVCSLVMSEARTVIAHFTKIAVLTVVRTGGGSGTVSSAPGGIACGADCDETYVAGTGITLSAMPAAGSRFVQWSGGCSGSIDGCALTLATDNTVIAEFAPTASTLTVTRTGTGTGTVTSSPAGISCGLDCSETYLTGLGVTLTAVADGDSIFDGWSGACGGIASTCTPTVAGAVGVTAHFSRLTTITVRMSGQGSVVAQIAPVVGPITCTHTTDPCSLTYRLGAMVSFTATPASGYHFDSFTSMVCQASPSSCAFSVAGPDLVEAYFCPTGTC